MASFNWTCPYCQRAQTVVPARFDDINVPITVGKTAEGTISGCISAIACSNPACNKTTISFSVRKNRGPNLNHTIISDYPALFSRQVLPEGSAKPQPDYIPAPLVEDYVEACLIREMSPKAAATLARRCIQGMIRDFCKITKSRLVDEINALRDAVNLGNGPAGVTIETVEAIDHVRSIGNIGAHMEKDINLIVPVDSGEAQALIELIEMLFEEWYVARHTRQQKLAEISKIGTEKKQLIADGQAETKALAAPLPEKAALQ
ncbi:DUF4145 domain-containing protein [Pedomonas mirosovicensis]|uniref:DUF4145 domain-containing protein n=1 Tax=Pedomonas mirosovicensis TaxID=2908641 RepID=UPI0021697976|nr:DUF4145 domain-containing protein [Pedomonas mirosovicensis]MCH8684950.1 DUF4145 domain-containing protein [Pedomonas mirosovicensis]